MRIEIFAINTNVNKNTNYCETIEIKRSAYKYKQKGVTLATG